MKKLLFFFMSFFTIVGYGQFFEGFEGAVFPPQDWARFDNGIGTLKQWNTTSSASLVYAGTKAAFMDKENVTDGTTSLDWLVTPQILVPANGQLRFYTKKTQSGIFGSSYTIRVSTTAQTTPSAFTTIKTWTEDDLVATFNVYEQKVIDLSAYANQNVYIAFVLEQDNGDRWLVDQVKVDQRCLVSTNLQATALSTSATLSWTSPNAPVNGPWEIEYGPAGFIPGTGTLVTNVTTNPYVLTGLQSLTNYSYIVRALCEPDNPSPWNEFPTSFQTQALPPECNGNYVDNGGITGNYTNSQDTVITICPTNTGDYVTVAFTQFITEAQYDKMYVYDGQSTAAPLISSGNGGGLGAVTIPGGFWGNLSGNLPGPFEATNATGCLTFRFVSDGVTNAAGWASNITCTPFPTCPKPSNVTSTVVSSSSIIVNWVNNAPSATQWEVIWLPAGSPPPTAGQTGAITNNPSTYTIQGLNSQTTYDIYVRAICQPGTDVGPWSTIKTTGTTQPNYCAGDHFYDLGGPTGNYPNNVTATNGGVTTICPQNPGDVVTVYFNSFNLVSSLGDTLTIYDGNTTTSTQVGTYFGPNVIPSYTSTSPTGCLTFSFVSNGTQNAAGWDATILCGPPCPSITAVLNSVVPAADATNTVKICQGGSVTFTGSGTFAGDSSGATYEWNFDDGTTATGLTATHTFANAGIYLVNLTIIDANGCRNTNRLNQKIYVSTTPLFTGTVAYDDEICEGQSTTITGVAAPVEFIRECAPPVSGTTFLPDGVGVSYLSTVPVDCFPFGTTITSASQITSVCINMEHSYLGDLELRLVSPNGQFIILKNFNGTGGGGGGTYLGCPLDDPAVGPGTGKTYCFTPSATTFLVNGTTSNCGTPNLPSINAGNYMPVNPFTNLIGSQLNGNWSLIVTDNLGVDNGYIFDWSINFDNSILPTDYSFTPVIVSTYWTADPTIVNTTGNTITVTPNVSGTKCYTYNVVDNFGCTYSKEVCIQVTPGVNLTNLNGMPAICTGSNGTFSFEGTPNTTVTYNVNGGANQTVLLDNNGLGTVTLTGLTASATLNATHINAQPIPTSGNAISVVGGVNPSNAVGALQPVGTTATTTNSTTINSNNATVTLTLGNELPPNTNVTVSLTRNNNAGSVTISDGVNSQIFNNTLFPGNLNTLQHINFVTGAFTSTITVTRNNGNTYLDGVYYNYNELGCDKPLLMSQTITVNPAPVITSVVHPASICGGGNASFVVTGTPNAVVTYNINAAADETITLDANGQATITVNAPTANVVLNITLVSLTPCSSTLNSTYTVQYLSSIPVPILTSNSPICANQTATFTLVGTPNAVVTYSLDGATATTVTLDATGNATVSVPNASANVQITLSNIGLNGCNTTLTNTETITVNPNPNVTNLTAVAAQICAGGDAVFTITGVANSVVTYTLNAGANETVTIGALGTATVTVTNPTANVTLAISVATLGSCTVPVSFSQTVQVNPMPMFTSLTSNSPICANQTATFTLVGTPNAVVTYSLNGATATTVTLDATGTATVSVPNASANVQITLSNIELNSCNSTLTNTETITVNPNPNVTNLTAAAAQICAGSDAVFTITGVANSVVTYTLNAGANQTVTIGALGTATVTVTNPTANVTLAISVATLGSCTVPVSFSQTVQVNPMPMFTSLTSNSPICANQTATFTLVGTPNGIVTYSLNGATATTVTLDATGTATVSVPNASANVQITLSNIGLNGCNTTLTNTETITVNPNPNVTNLTAAAAQICAGGDAVFTITGVANSVVTYTLNAGASQTVTIGASGTATVTVTNPTANVTLAISGATLGSCSVTVSFSQTVQVKPMPVFTSLASNSPICANQTATFTLVGTPNGIVTYSLNGATATTVTLNATGTATVSVPNVSANVQIVLSSINLNGCLVSLTNTNTITVNPVPVTPTVTPSKTDACIGDDLLFTITGSANAVVTYSLNNGSLQTLTLNASGSGTVSVLAASSTTLLELETTTLGSCSANLTVSSQVVVLPCEIQKGISPNNDGLNDNFQLEAFNVSKLEIFNRYGTKVYSKNNYENEWYGQSNGGQELPDGTYYYVITFTDMDAKTGWIYINREQ